MIFAGLIAAAGLLFLALKLGIRKVISYDIIFDIAITAILMVSLAGTYSGMMAALLGGLIVSTVLFTMKRTMIRERLAFARSRIPIYKDKVSIPFVKLKWVTVYPRRISRGSI